MDRIRRGLVTASVLLPVAVAAARAQTPANAAAVTGADRTRTALKELGFIGPEDDPDFNKAVTAVGAGPARHEEISKAFRLIFDCPRDSDHMKIARYFQDIADKNADGEKYNEEWKDRSNPLIVDFFGMTNTLPNDGDQTYWCAAFVSFVLHASGRASRFSALSGGYRKYSTETTTPKPGDIVVFRKVGPDGDKGHGHVGFYLSQTPDDVELLGGNQRGDTGSTGAITVARYQKRGQRLQLHSYRSVPALP